MGLWALGEALRALLFHEPVSQLVEAAGVDCLRDLLQLVGAIMATARLLPVFALAISWSRKPISASPSSLIVSAEIVLQISFSDCFERSVTLTGGIAGRIIVRQDVA